jgi:hypothetical protein
MELRGGTRQQFLAYRLNGEGLLRESGCNLQPLAFLDGWCESAEDALIASPQQRRQLVHERLRVALMQGIHRAAGPLAQRFAVHEGQHPSRDAQRGPLH